jgi:hypothetical protein
MSSLREALESAAATVEAKNEPAEAAAETPAVGRVDAVSEAPAEAAAEASEATESASAAAARRRDEAGRFTKGQSPKPEAKAVAPKNGDAGRDGGLPPKPTVSNAGDAAGVPASPQPQSETEVKAPQSWTPMEREHFAKAPPEVRQAVLRREKEIASALQETAPARKFHQEFQATIAPFAGILQGAEPMRVVGSLLQTVSQLQGGTPQQQAQIIGNLVKSYRVPIEALAHAIDGTQQPQGGQQSQTINPEAILQQAEARVLQRLQAQQHQQEAQKWQKDVQSFAANHEFFEPLEPGQSAPVGSVRWLMTMAIQSAQAQGKDLSLEDAYNYATRAHPEVSQVLQQRTAAEAAKATQASTQRARAASTSLKTQPAGVATPQPKGIRAALEAAAAKHGG